RYEPLAECLYLVEFIAFYYKGLLVHVEPPGELDLDRVHLQVGAAVLGGRKAAAVRVVMSHGPADGLGQALGRLDDVRRGARSTPAAGDHVRACAARVGVSGPPRARHGVRADQDRVSELGTFRLEQGGERAMVRPINQVEP